MTTVEPNAKVNVEVGGRAWVMRALRIVAPLIAILVMIQAIFASRGLFFGGDAFAIHGGIGNLTFLLVLAQAVLAFFTGLRGRARTLLLGGSLLLLVLTVAQLGLGYSGRDSIDAAAWHVPNGVLIFGLSIANLSLIYRLGRR